jgi:arginine deiminase
MQVKVKSLENSVNVTSETGRLTKVLIHRPDEGIEKVTPSRALDLLYEDIVYLPKMREEHDVFTQALSIFTGVKNLVDVQDLLTDILEVPEIKKELLDISLKLENQSLSELRKYFPLDAHDIAKLMITGSIESKTLFNPLPNFIFTRDIGVVINNFLLICHASKIARRRESLISSYIFKHHPLFKNVDNDEKIINLSDWKEFSSYSENDQPMSVEGGDIMIFGKDHLIMATSERTTARALVALKNILLEREVVKKITIVDLPADRYCMHLDTVFTKISNKECVGFAPLIMEENRMAATVYDKDGRKEKFSSLKSALLNENPWIDFIACGEGIAPFAEREQWTDGCNLVAVKDGVAFTYDRNIKTNEALKDHGFKIVKATDLIEEFSKGKLKPENIERTIITIPSSELSRARGGPHCMTMPLCRE